MTILRLLVSRYKTYHLKNIIQKLTKSGILVKSGFPEIINDPFVSESSKHSIFLDNPLDSNKFLQHN